MGLTTVKAMRPTRNRAEETVARIVDGCLLEGTLQEDCTYTTRRVCRKGEILCGEYLICARCLCIAYSIYPGRPGLRSSLIQEMRGYGTNNGKRGSESW